MCRRDDPRVRCPAPRQWSTAHWHASTGLLLAGCGAIFRAVQTHDRDWQKWFFVLISSPTMRRDLTTTSQLESASSLDLHPKRNARRRVGILAGLTLFVGTIASPAFGRGLPAQNGIINFGQINEGLYRGAQPDEAALRNLKSLGVKMIINLRMAGDTWKREAIEAQANGIIYTNVPLRGTGRPVNDQVSKALTIIQTAPGPVFVHCQHGCDRTGTIIACYRIRHDGWSSEAALAEARRYGMSKLERSMRAYVVDFGRDPKSAPLKAKQVDLTARK